MLIKAGTPIGIRTRIFDPDGNRVGNVFWLDTVTGKLGMWRLVAPGKILVEDGHLVSDEVDGTGYTYQIADGPRLPIKE
jgi:hypothetical protein